MRTPRSMFLLIALLNVARVKSRLVAAAVIPHGDFAYDPTLLKAGTPERQAAEQVALASRIAGSFISRSDPDILFISTPHGIQLETNFGVYLGSHANGSATIGLDLPNSTAYEVDVPNISLAPRLSLSLISNLFGERVSAIMPPTPLLWGEVIPLLMIKQSSTLEGSYQTRKHMIWSHPHRRYAQAAGMVPELVRIGRKLFAWTEASPLRISIVVSSDLSHTHQADGPYGYANASALFDAAVGDWAMDPCNRESSLLDEARSLQHNAKSCGFTGLVLLHGALCHSNVAANFEPTLLANRNATYYGMMAATFARRKNLNTHTMSK